MEAATRWVFRLNNRVTLIEFQPPVATLDLSHIRVPRLVINTTLFVSVLFNCQQALFGEP